jgi:hypothetical protein
MSAMTVVKNLKCQIITVVRNLQIDIYDESAEFVQRIICKHADFAPTYTNLIDISKFGANKFFMYKKKVPTFTLPFDVDTWNIDGISGVITVYYKQGFFIEATRLNV